MELLNTGHDVLIREYEKDGEWYVYSQLAMGGGRKGVLYSQCFDQEEPVQANVRKLQELHL